MIDCDLYMSIQASSVGNGQDVADDGANGAKVIKHTPNDARLTSIGGRVADRSDSTKIQHPDSFNVRVLVARPLECCAREQKPN